LLSLRPCSEGMLSLTSRVLSEKNFFFFAKNETQLPKVNFFCLRKPERAEMIPLVAIKPSLITGTTIF
jgi:hypothetical protein